MLYTPCLICEVYRFKPYKCLLPLYLKIVLYREAMATRHPPPLNLQTCYASCLILVFILFFMVFFIISYQFRFNGSPFVETFYPLACNWNLDVNSIQLTKVIDAFISNLSYFIRPKPPFCKLPISTLLVVGATIQYQYPLSLLNFIYLPAIRVWISVPSNSFRQQRPLSVTFLTSQYPNHLTANFLVVLYWLSRFLSSTHSQSPSSIFWGTSLFILSNLALFLTRASLASLLPFLRLQSYIQVVGSKQQANLPRSFLTPKEVLPTW